MTEDDASGGRPHIGVKGVIERDVITDSQGTDKIDERRNQYMKPKRIEEPAANGITLSGFTFTRLTGRLTALAMLAVLLLVTAGCQQISARIQHEKDMKELKARYVEIGNYVEAAMEKKYGEDFENLGIHDTSWTADPYYADRANVVFTLQSNHTGFKDRFMYGGKYAYPGSTATIESGNVSYGTYYNLRNAYELGEHDRAKIDEFFPGFKPEPLLFYELEAPYRIAYYAEPEAIDPKYFDVDYMFANEKEALGTYHLTMDYFRNVYPENKEEMLQDIYDFLMYTRSLGFKRCDLDIWIYETSVLESPEYAEYMEGGKGVSMWLYMEEKNVRAINIHIEADESEKFNSIDELKKNVKVYEKKGGKPILW